MNATEGGTTLVPDRLGIVTGWKGFASIAGEIRTDKVIWPRRQKLQATCLTMPTGHYEWHVVGDDEMLGEMPWRAEWKPSQPTFGMGTVTTSSGAATAYIPPNPPVPPMPPIFLPRGLRWHFGWVPNPKHPSPAEGCTCGIYLADKIAEADRYANGVIARVAGWGKTIEHAGGYRVEFAYPLKLYVQRPIYEKSDLVAATLAENYSVTAKVVDGLEDALRDD